jgi:osmotically-inducible protein OsmY
MATNHGEVPKRKNNNDNGSRDAANDERLLERLRKKMRALPMDDVQIEIQNGFVTLKGKVRTFRQKERLHRTVMGLHGVRALKDLLAVQPLETIADREIALHVRQALDAHAELPPGTAAVHVQNGVVCLEGNVRTAEERHVVEHVVNHCRGVAKVENHLLVDPLEEISDEAAVRAVQGALAYSADFETQEVRVSCADGHVCLRGAVPTLLDRNYAEEMARLQAGVRSVENCVQVAGHAPFPDEQEQK